MNGKSQGNLKSRRAGRTLLLIALLAGALALPFLVSNYRVFQFNMVLVYAIVLLGLNILTGYNGQISLGHGAFYAIGAYVAAILMDHFGWPYWATLPVAGTVCFVFGFLFGFRPCVCAVTIWRSLPLPSRWQCRKCSDTSTSSSGRAECRASSSSSPMHRLA